MTSAVCGGKTRAARPRRICKVILCMLLCVGVGGRLWSASEESEAWRARTAWFRDAKYGIFTHYLSQAQTNPRDLHSDGVARSWDECVNGFDVERYADGMKRMGAGYAVFTVMQGRRQFACPNAALEREFGVKPTERPAQRDLIMELADALAARGIPLMLYWTGDGPDRDDHAMQAQTGYTAPINRAWAEKWARVLECCACRYGRKVRGWWIDGCYQKWGSLSYTPELLRLYEQAIRKGNPDAIVAFNNPISCEEGPIVPYMPFEDFTAGEMNNLSQYPTGRDIGRQWHVLTFLGTPFWGDSGVRYSSSQLGEYIYLVNRLGGVATFDVSCSWDGGFERAQVNAFAGVRSELKRWETLRGPAGNVAYGCPARILNLEGKPLQGQRWCRDAPLHATDGDLATALQGCFEWPWQLEVDLISERNIARVLLNYRNRNYATRLRVSVSIDGKSWKVVWEGGNDDPAKTEVAMDHPARARYVRIAALKPDGPDQKGYQMCLAEVAVFESALR